MKARLLLIGLFLLTSACGFHLRGSQLTDFNIANIYIHQSGAPKLTKEVTSQLESAGVTVATTPEGASYIVTLKQEGYEKSVLSVSAATGKVEEYLITYKAKMDLMQADGKKIVENDPISMSRDFTFDENSVLGKFSEEEVLREDLVLRSSGQVLRRLQALITTGKKK